MTVIKKILKKDLDKMMFEIFQTLYNKFLDVENIKEYIDSKRSTHVNSIYIEVYMNSLTFANESSAKEFELELIEKIRMFTDNNIGNHYEIIYNQDWNNEHKGESKIKILKIILSCNYTIIQ